ncbi:hypothetical protein Ahy_B09g099108 [Arachis hypogaea]|uniref:Uncharacterized protein n=1 Tax=Arachis hypogaea TaxID=3818 RepID=A0A444XTT5_ARAHY|nr:hypothetical protein Ahy_B09g099108 [Arachis hypogaea]
MHAKCVIQDNDEVGIRPNKTYLTLENEDGGSSKLGYSEKNVRNYITSNLRCTDENADTLKELSPVHRALQLKDNFSVSTQPLSLGKKKRDCLVRGVTQEGDLFCVTVNEQYLLYREPRGLCSHFFNVARKFVTCEEETAMLHSGLDELRAKLFDYHANLGFISVPTTQNSMVTQQDPTLGASKI